MRRQKMPQLTKQFAIIEKLKSLVKKSTRPFRRRGENMAISEDIARKIQKNSYDQSHAKVKDAVTPPYKSIAEQLQVEDDQIFRGAIFNLANIALTAEKYAREIIVVMEKALEQEQRTPDQLEYVKNRIAAIKAAHGYK